MFLQYNYTPIAAFWSRLQLTVCVSQILRHDFPDKWPGVVDKVNTFLAENSQATWMGALLTLYQIVKKYE